MLQERFLLHSPSSSADTTGSWWVPVSYGLRQDYYTEATNAPVKTWIAPKQNTSVELADSAQWLLVNLDRRGNALGLAAN